MDLHRSAAWHNIGTFWLTVIVLGLMVWPLIFPKDGNVQANPSGNQIQTETKAKPVNTVPWVMPSILAGALLIAGVLNFLASRPSRVKDGIAPIAARSIVGKPTIVQSPPTGKFSTMGFRWMRDECVKLHVGYTTLQNNYSERSRKPLDKNSWPWPTGPKSEWDYVQLQMFFLEQSFRVFQELTQREWVNMGWTNDLPEILNVPDSEVLTGVLIALEKHKDLLTQKIASVLQTKNAM